MNKRYIAIAVIFAVALMIAFISFKMASCERRTSLGDTLLNKLDAVYEHGIKMYSSGRTNKAIKALEVVSKEAPKDYKQRPDALRKLKDLYEKKQNIAQVREVLKILIYDYPNSRDILQYQKELEELNIKILLSPIPVKESIMYEIKPGDTLGRIAKKYGTTVELIKLSNNLKSSLIIPGRKLKIWKGKFSILVDRSQNILILKSDGDIIKKYTVSTGLNSSTPLGKFNIEEKLISPVWYKIGAVVSPNSEEYELGTRWMGISEPGYGIHGTSDESTIGKHITKGCVRMKNNEIEELYAIVPSGTVVEIIE
jgi:lipoprotein-anchoring transpeptidase ErfK/SrfK